MACCRKTIRGMANEIRPYGVWHNIERPYGV